MSYEACINTVKKYDPDRFFISVFANKETHHKIMALYAFNFELSHIFETISEPMMGQIRFQWWWDLVGAIYNDDKPVPPHPIAEDLETLKNDIDQSLLHSLIEGHEEALEPSPPETEKDLIDLLEKKSFNLFRAISKIETPARDDRRFYNLSIAWGLIGIIRAIPYHARNNKIYLPVSYFKESIKPDQNKILDMKPDSEAFLKSVEKLWALAQHHLEKAEQDRKDHANDKSHLWLYLKLAKLYLKDIRKRGYQAFDTKLANRPAFAELKIGLRGLMRLY